MFWLSFAVPSPAPIAPVLNVNNVSYRILNLWRFAMFLYPLYRSVSSMSPADGAAPLHCLSHHTIILTESCELAAPPNSAAWATFVFSRQNRMCMLVMVHFLPILWFSPVPCTIPTMLFVVVIGVWALVDTIDDPAVVKAASVNTRSMNFFSGLRPFRWDLNLPNIPPTRLYPRLNRLNDRIRFRPVYRLRNIVLCICYSLVVPRCIASVTSFPPIVISVAVPAVSFVLRILSSSLLSVSVVS